MQLLVYSGGEDKSPVGGSLLEYKGVVEDWILEYNPDTKEWSKIGSMKEARSGHAVAIVNFDDFKDQCVFQGSYKVFKKLCEKVNV